MSFPKQIAVALVVVGGIGYYPLTVYGTEQTIRAAEAGAILATINVLLGYAAVAYSIGKSTTVFFKYVLGGMGIRMFLLAGLLAVLIRMFGFDPAALVISLGIFYIVFLALEVLFIQRQISLRQNT
ncbi:MAG TPA: hypothetical protein VMW43_10240 [Bacteroidota bacterium]|nr:hypothetical protein [Bacteroidota bacterium]